MHRHQATVHGDVHAHLRSIGTEILALLLAAHCAGCDAPEVLLCESCRARLRPDPTGRYTPGGVLVHAALSFDGIPARCIRRMKDEGETLLARPLGAALAAVIPRTGGDPPVLVPVPTSRRSLRRRGYRVPDLLIRRAGATPTRALALAGAGVDQRGLGVAQRAVNARGSMRATRAGAGREAVVVDDVMTTGATLDEAARTLERAGYRVVSAIALAATPRHSEH